MLVADLNHFKGNHFKPAALNALDDFAYESALYAIRLYQG
jgi:hypothetical protein